MKVQEIITNRIIELIEKKVYACINETGGLTFMLSDEY